MSRCDIGEPFSALDSLLQANAAKDAAIATLHARMDSMPAVPPDTVVRVAAPVQNQAWTWVWAAVAAVLTGMLVQYFRVYIEEARERERVRRLLASEVAALRGHLEHVEKLAHAWQLPAASHYWLLIDNAMNGYDASRTKATLLPGPLAARTHGFFLRVKGLRLGAESLAIDYSRELNAHTRTSGDALEVQFKRDFEHVEQLAANAVMECEDAFRNLHAAAPKGWPGRTLAGVERHALEEELRMWDAGRVG